MNYDNSGCCQSTISAREKNLLSLGVVLFILLMCATAAQAQNQLNAYTNPPASTPNFPDFTAKVEIPGGSYSNLFDYLAIMHNIYSGSDSNASGFVMFDCSGTVQMQVTYNAGSLDSVQIWPKAYGITPTINGDVVTFSMTNGQDAILEVNGNPMEALHIFANPMDTNIPSPGASNVWYFAPGLHKHGGSGVDTNIIRYSMPNYYGQTPDVTGDFVSVPSGITVYIAPGAVVQAGFNLGDVNGNFGATNATIRGRGVIDCAPWCGDFAEDAKNTEPWMSGIGTGFACSNITIQGVVVLNPISQGLGLGNCVNVTINGVKSFTCMNAGDGIDWDDVTNITVENSFVRSADDCSDISITSGVVYTNDVFCDNCNGCHIFVTGLGGTVVNYLAENCYIEFDTGNAMGVSCNSLNLTFKNIQVERDYAPPINLWTWNEWNEFSAPMTNITFNNVNMNSYYLSYGSGNWSTVGGDTNDHIVGLSFTNCYFNGNLITNAASGELSIGSYVTNVLFNGVANSTNLAFSPLVFSPWPYPSGTTNYFLLFDQYVGSDLEEASSGTLAFGNATGTKYEWSLVNDNGYVRFVNRSTGHSLYAASDSESALKCGAVTDSRADWMPIGEGFTQFRNRLHALCYMATPVSGGTAEARPLVQADQIYGQYSEWFVIGVAPIPNGTYNMVNLNSGLALDDPGSGGSGTGLDQQASGGSNQEWIVTSVGGGHYKIASAVNGLVVSGPTSDAQLVLNSYTGANDQKWAIYWTNGFSPPDTISNMGSGELMSDSGLSTVPGAIIDQETLDGSSSPVEQQWELVFLNSGTNILCPAPTGLTAMAGNGQVALSWNATSGATSYNVGRATTSGGPYTTIASPTSTNYTDTSVVNGTTYYYVVAANNSAGTGPNSAQVSATPTGSGIPPAPTGLMATAGNGQVSLLWTSSTGATSYNVKRSTTDGGPYTTIASPTSTSYTDTSVVNGTTYYYVVSAVNSNGESANSPQVSATPMPPPPTPTGLTATAGDRQVSLSWSVSTGATSYNVGRATTSGGPYTTIASPTSTNYTDTNVVNGTTYYYVVAAVNDYGESANSSQVSATPEWNVISIQLLPAQVSGPWAGLTLAPLSSTNKTGVYPTTNWNPEEVNFAGDYLNFYTNVFTGLNDQLGYITPVQLTVLGVNDGWAINNPPADSAPITDLLNTFVKSGPSSNATNTLGQGKMKFVLSNLANTNYDIYLYVNSDPNDGIVHPDVDAGNGITNYSGPFFFSASSSSVFVGSTNTNPHGVRTNADNYVVLYNVTPSNGVITVTEQYDPVLDSYTNYIGTGYDPLGACGLQIIISSMDQ